MITTDDASQYPVYPYHCIMRPPGPGAVPIDGLAYCDFKEGTTLDGRHYWGTAVYTRKLSDEEVRRWELAPTCFVVTDGCIE